MLNLIDPKPFVVKDQNGKERTFILSKFPAVQGREIISKYPISAMPKLGDYDVNEETMIKLMNYVAVETAKGVQQKLTNIDLINNHCGDWETLARVEVEMLQYNCSFFLRDKALTFLDASTKMLSDKVTSILMGLLEQLSQRARQPSKS